MSHATASPRIEPDEIELSVVMPCLNEAETLAACIVKARDCLTLMGVAGEVVIADNGSTDGSQDIALEHGARVIDVDQRGYGAALMGGIHGARGKYVIMGDADLSYDFSALEPFLTQLRAGHELVMGNRFRGGVAPGAMPALHRYLGNPVLTTIGRLLFGSRCGDFHCGLRGFDRAAILGLDLQTTGMEFASEMVVKATLRRLDIVEVPTTLSPDGRSRPPHLRSWRDGWRHLRFLLMFSPRWLYLVPGLTLVAIGASLMVIVWPGTLFVGGIGLDVHTMVGAAGMIVIGTQMLTFGLLAKKHGVNQGILPRDSHVMRVLELFNLERALLAGLSLFLIGFVGLVLAVVGWGRGGFSELDQGVTMRTVVPSVTAMVVGVQIAISGFMSSILDLQVSQRR